MGSLYEFDTLPQSVSLSSLPPIFDSSVVSSTPRNGFFGKCSERWWGRKGDWRPLRDSNQTRLITRENPYKFNISRRGSPLAPVFADLYHVLLDTTWWKLLFGLCLFFFTEHLFFALLYYQDRQGLKGLDPNDQHTLADFWTCFFFSVQTMQTIGYGGLSPESVYCNVLVCIQAFWGMLSTAVITGFVFAKIGRPSRQKRNIMFSELAVVNTLERHWQGNPDRLSEGHYVEDGQVPCLVLRFCNTRRSQVCEPRFRLLLLRRETETPLEDYDDVVEDQGIAEDDLEGHKNYFHGGDSVRAHRQRAQGESFRIHELNFEINSVEYRARGVDFSSALLPLPWTVVHAMDERSPLYGATPASLSDSDTEIIAVLDGTDEVCSEQMHARWSYTYREIVWDARLVPVVGRSSTSGKYVVDLSRFHDIVPVDAIPPRRPGTPSSSRKSRREDTQ